MDKNLFFDPSKNMTMVLHKVTFVWRDVTVGASSNSFYSKQVGYMLEKF